MNTKAKTDPPRDLTCDPLSCESDAAKSFYVHLMDGEIAVVSDVSGLEITDTSIRFLRGAMAPVAYPRTAVYFTCCSQDRSPAEF